MGILMNSDASQKSSQISSWLFCFILKRSHSYYNREFQPPVMTSSVGPVPRVV